MAPLLIAVMGPTASGKSALAEALADKLEAQLISADAFQVYRGLDIGTNKPQARESYAMLDICDPQQQFGVGEYVLSASTLLQDLYLSGRNVVIVGGTGLYIRALTEQWKELQPPPPPELRAELGAKLATRGLDALVAELRTLSPNLPAAFDWQNPARVMRALERAKALKPPIAFAMPPYKMLKIGLEVDRQTLAKRIDSRAVEMLTGGWLQEVETLAATGVRPGHPAMRAIGYLDVWEVVHGLRSFKDACSRIQATTRAFAKRQRAWLRTEPGIQMLEATRGLPSVSQVLDFV